jgi:transposase
MTKAPLAREAVGLSPTDRGKKGSKRHLLVKERGVPLSIVLTGANRHGLTQLETVLDNIVIMRQSLQLTGLSTSAPTKLISLELYKEYNRPGLYPSHSALRRRNRGEKNIPGYRARRWVVEVCHSWLNRFRKILVRYGKTHASYVALLHL